jgi:hypothetical protein
MKVTYRVRTSRAPRVAKKHHSGSIFVTTFCPAGEISSRTAHRIRCSAFVASRLKPPRGVSAEDASSSRSSGAQWRSTASLTSANVEA